MTHSKIVPAAVYPLMLCLLVAACGRVATPDNTQARQPRDIQPPAEVAPAQPEIPAPINLSRELLDDIVDEQAHTIHAREPTLPDLFKPDADDRKTTIGGSLILKDGPTQMSELVDGVEVKIEIPTS